MLQERMQHHFLDIHSVRVNLREFVFFSELKHLEFNNLTGMPHQFPADA